MGGGGRGWEMGWERACECDGFVRRGTAVEDVVRGLDHGVRAVSHDDPAAGDPADRAARVGSASDPTAQGAGEGWGGGRLRISAAVQGYGPTHAARGASD